MALLSSLQKPALDDDGPKTYSYVAVSPAGSRVKSKMTAPNPQAVSAALQAEGWIPLDVKPVMEQGLQMDLGQLWANRPLKLSHAELAAFSRQFNQLLKAGLSIPKAISALGEDAEPKMAAMCQDIADKVASGTSLAAAFAEYPSVFDDVFIAYISAGEVTGDLQATTERLAKMLEKRASLANKIKSVTAYPKMVSIAIGLIVLGIFVFLVPQYEEIYATFGAELPGPTQAVVAISHQILPVSLWNPIPFVYLPYPNLLSPTLWLLVLIVAFRVFLRMTKDDLDVGTRLDKIRFRMPVFGQLNFKSSLFRWSSTLAGALTAGVQQQPALELAARAAGSRWQQAVTVGHVEAVRGGKLLSESLGQHRELYPSNIRAMVTTGEQAGELSSMLDSVSNAIDDEIDTIVSGLSAKIEVALLIIMGVVVGLLLVALYLPILELAVTAGEGLSGGEF